MQSREGLHKKKIKNLSESKMSFQGELNPFLQKGSIRSSDDRINPESLWFRVVTFILTGFFAALFITNAIYFDRIIRGSCSTVNLTELTTLYWLNVILAIITILLFIWTFFRLTYHSKQELVILT